MLRVLFIRLHLCVFLNVHNSKCFRENKCGGKTRSRPGSRAPVRGLSGRRFVLGVGPMYSGYQSTGRP